VLVNLQAEKQFGYRREELVGQKVKNIIPKGLAERLIADDLRSAGDALAQQIGTGIELTGRRKDGSEFPIEIMLSPLESADGIPEDRVMRNAIGPAFSGSRRERNQIPHLRSPPRTRLCSEERWQGVAFLCARQ